MTRYNVSKQREMSYWLGIRTVSGCVSFRRGGHSVALAAASGTPRENLVRPGLEDRMMTILTYVSPPTTSVVIRNCKTSDILIWG
jgi:hypothetical protein